MFKKFTTALLLVLFATTTVAQTGLTCEDPIPVGTNYEGKIDGPCTIWYTANTYDLPLLVFFVPDSADTQASPEIMVDFTCTPGIYDDSKLDSLINQATIFGVEMPIKFTCGHATHQGRKAWKLSIEDSYRETLTSSGINYNVPAKVKVTFPEAGMITMTPDTVYSSCLERAEYLHLGDTIDILPNDSNRVFVMPYMDWKNDSIQFVWIGDNEARVWLAVDECKFIPTTQSAYVWTYYDVVKGQPYKLQSKEIKDAINVANTGGIFFSKVLSATAGKLVVEKIPETPPAGGAILLEYDKPVVVQANSDQLYAFPKTWNQATMFQPSMSGDFQVQICNSHTFEVSTGIYVNTYDANMYDEYAVHMTSLDMEFNTKNAKDKYMYVRFVTAEKTTVVAHLWDVSPCIDISRPIYANQSFNLTSSGSSNFYRLNYSEFSGYDLTVNWEGSARMTFSIGDTCKFVNNSSHARVIHYKAVNKKTAYLIPAATVDSWAPHVDAEGFLYVRFSGVNGKITFQTEKPEPEIPVIPTDPCVVNSIEIKTGDQLTLNLDSAFTVYRIEYAAWKDKGISLSWTGTTDLHTFVAETCTFAVAPYNKYVHVYVPVQGEHTLDAAAMADLAAYVDENGYLYIRFLTEKEGVLEVK